MSNITLTIPNDDHIALRAFGKALEEMALAHGASPTQLQVVNEITMSDKQRETLKERLLNLRRSRSPLRSELETAPVEQIDALVKAGKEVVEKDIAELDTTAQQVESLASAESLTDKLNRLFIDGGDINPTTDSTGTPWDERIHSASKALNADGTWRLRRKPKDMDEAEWSAYVEGIKACYEIDDSPVQQVEQPFTCEQRPINLNHVSIEPTREEVDTSNKMLEPPVTPPGDDFHTDAGVVTEQTVAGIPPIPVPPPVVVPPVPVADEVWTFPKLMVFLTNHNGKISIETVNQILSKQGMQSLKDLNGNENSIPAFVRAVQSYLETESASN